VKVALVLSAAIVCAWLALALHGGGLFNLFSP
jgi:hypothetical protein